MSPPADSDSKHFPPEFQELSRPRVRYLFWVGILLCAATLVANTIRDNELVYLEPYSIWDTLLRLKVIGNDAAISLFAALVAGLIGYEQFYSVQRPHLTYNGIRTNAVSFDQTASGKYWTTVLRNGGGLARVTKVSYQLRLANGLTFEGEHYAEAIRFLEANGIREGIDFVLFRLSRGETIRAGGDWLVLEVHLETAMQRIDAIDVSVHVTGVAGGHFMRGIFCIPRRWALARQATEPTLVEHSDPKPADTRPAEAPTPSDPAPQVVADRSVSST